MNPEKDLLDEYDEHPFKTNNVYKLLVILVVVFISALNLSTYIYSGRSSFDWIDIILGIVIPGIGLALLIAKKKAGWFISIIYYSFLFYILAASFINEMFIRINPGANLYLKIRQLFFLLLTILLTLLLLLKTTRNGFQIGLRGMITALSVSILLAFIVISKVIFH